MFRFFSFTLFVFSVFSFSLLGLNSKHLNFLFCHNFEPSQTLFLANSSNNTSKSIDVYKTQIKSLILKKNYSNASLLLKEALFYFPNQIELLKMKKEFVLNDYKENYLNIKSKKLESIYEKKYNISRCYAGVLSKSVLNNSLEVFQYVRRLAGVNDSVYFDAVLNKNSQEAAIIMSSNQTLNHEPKSNMKCYTKNGALAASRSNLSLGYGFNNALMGQIEDDGLSNSSCGHRRWILNPFNRKYGIGSTDDAMVFCVINYEKFKKMSFLDSLPVAWPSFDYFPLELAPERWSYSLVDADFSKAKVVVKLKGKAQLIQQERVSDGYALNTIVWKFKSKLELGQAYDVSIEKIGLIEKGKLVYKSASYKVEFVAE